MEPAFYQPRKVPPPSTAPSLFDPPAAEPAHVPPPAPPAGVIPETPARRAQRARERVESIHQTTSRRWIDLGKPIALAVARAQGSVTAERFRDEAELHPGVLRPVDPADPDRTLSYLTQMFAELVKEGALRKRRRADGSVVKELSKKERNEHTVYELVEA